MLIRCKYCGNEFDAKPVHVRTGRAKYCSKECQAMARRTGKEITCLVCGAKRYVKVGRLKEGGGKFCSKECHNKYLLLNGGRKTGTLARCSNCGKEIYIQEWQRKKFDRHYCSRKCHDKHKAITVGGNNSPLWKGDNHSYKGADGYVYVRNREHPKACNGYVKRATLVAEEKIGRELLPRELVHHVNEIRDDDRPENLSVIYRGEHNKIHFTKADEDKPFVVTKCLTCGEEIIDYQSSHRKFCDHACTAIFNKPRLGTGKQCQL